jgi:hypothetical protein
VRTLIQTLIVVVGVFAMISISTNLPQDSLQLEFALAWTQRAFGALIAVAAGVMVLVRAAQNQTLEQLLPLTLAALVGVLIVASNWALRSRSGR